MQDTMIWSKYSAGRFPVASVSSIIDKVLKDELDKKEYDADEAKEWSINISETIKAKVKGESTYCSSAKSAISHMLVCFTEDCNIPRYKIIVQVTTGELKDQGVRVASRCLWDTATDNYASSSFKNVSRLNKA